MGYYELDGRQVAEVVVRALGKGSPLRDHFSETYQGLGPDGERADPGDAAVAHFIDRLFCIVQEEIGDAEVRTEGPYWAEALGGLDEVEEG